MYSNGDEVLFSGIQAWGNIVRQSVYHAEFALTAALSLSLWDRMHMTSIGRYTDRLRIEFQLHKNEAPLITNEGRVLAQLFI